MKKILLATTLLVGTAGFAAAEVTLSGDARMGIANDGTDTTFNSRARVKFTLAGETDSGLSFGASFRADNANTNSVSIAADGPDADAVADVTNTQGGAVVGLAGSVFISGEFGKLAMGDNDSAAQATVGHVAGVGYTGLSDLNEIAYLGDANESALYTYSAGALSFALSAGQIGSDDVSAAASYTTDAFTVALGVEDDGGEDNHVVVGGSATVGPVALKAVYGQLGDLDQYALSAVYSADALSLTVFTRADFDEVQYTGVGAAYDLGGGASLAAGYTKTEGADGIYDAGVNFSF